MSRVKTFDATGIAPNGMFFAGDANAIQDHYADLSNFTQTVDVSTLRVGETGLQLIRYASSPLEARITGALRADGIVRGLSGVAPGIYTTTARDAIPAGQRPQGMMIFNSTTGTVEVNKGTDATPTWEAIGLAAIPIGTIIPFTGAEGSVPANFSLADGGAISRTTYAALNTLYSAQSYPFGSGDGSTTFNKPDLRGRVAPGRDNMGGSAASRMSGVNTMGASGGASTVALVTGEMPSHSHGGSTGTGTSGSTSPGTGVESADHSHSGTTATNSVVHNHNSADIVLFTANMQGILSGGVAFTYVYNATITGAFNRATGNENQNHVHAFTTGGVSATHTHTVNAHTHTVPALSITAEGGGAAHNNLQPYVAVNWIVKVL